MTHLNASGWAFVLSNLAITMGYVFLAAVVIPRITVRLHRTRWGGIGFFLLCGLHHLDNVFHFLLQGTDRIDHIFVEWHMLLIDVPQAVCVWAFVTGLYIELVKWGPWATQPPGRRYDDEH